MPGQVFSRSLRPRNRINSPVKEPRQLLAQSSPIFTSVRLKGVTVQAPIFLYFKSRILRTGEFRHRRKETATKTGSRFFVLGSGLQTF